MYISIPEELTIKLWQQKHISTQTKKNKCVCVCVFCFFFQGEKVKLTCTDRLPAYLTTVVMMCFMVSISSPPTVLEYIIEL